MKNKCNHHVQPQYKCLVEDEVAGNNRVFIHAVMKVGLNKSVKLFQSNLGMELKTNDINMLQSYQLATVTCNYNDFTAELC